MGCNKCGKGRRTARKVGASEEAMARAKELRKHARTQSRPTIKRPPPKAQKPNARAVPYVILRGDTMADIARKFGITTQEMAKYDGGTGVPNIARLRSKNIHTLLPGEVILVPKKGN